MKRILISILIALLIFSAAACTKNEKPAVSNEEPATSNEEPATSNEEPATPDEEPAVSESPDDPSQWKTLGDIWEFESPTSGSEENCYIRVFEADGVYYRAEADVPQDVLEKLYTIDFFDETGEAQEKELMKDLPITKVCNLSEAMLSQSELDALAGKTGQELLDMGFVPGGSYGFSAQEQISWASMEKGPFEYEVEFHEYVDVDEDPNVAAVIRPLTVKSVTLFGISQYASGKAFDINGGRSLADYEAQFNED